jgi:hypothetical protein
VFSTLLCKATGLCTTSAPPVKPLTTRRGLIAEFTTEFTAEFTKEF